jgi:DNA polymerase-3 subunit delta'
MNTNAANALLKTLEEPPKNTVFLLISHNPQSLLPTIKSRCRELRLSNLTENDLISALRQINLTIPENDSEIYSLLGSGSVGNSIRLLEHDGAGLYRALLSFLSQLPNLNGFELEKFIGTFSGNKNRSRLELFIELLNVVIARISKAGIIGHSASHQILKDEKEIFEKLCPTPNIAQKWAELAQTQSENLKHGLAVNLDPGSLILDTFFRIEDCARTVR